LPESVPSVPSIRLEGTFRLKPRRMPPAQWLDLEKAKGRLCACGCGEPIRIKPHHRLKGVPRFHPGHHVGGMTKVVAEIRARGGMTASEAANELGIGRTTLVRLEGVAYTAVKRLGSHRARLYSPTLIQLLRARFCRRT
jgi:hypothetical protein